MAVTSYVKFVRGSQDFYNNLEKKDQNTLYFIYEDINSSSGKLYLGNKLISISNKDEKFDLSNLQDVVLNGPFKDGQFFVYDEYEHKWTNQTIADAFEIEIMTGATETDDGLSGLVPVPVAGEQGKLLRGDGTWIDINEIDSISNLQSVIGDFVPVPPKYLNISSAISYFNTSIMNLEDKTRWHNFDD